MILLSCGQVSFVTYLKSQTEVQKHATSIQYAIDLREIKTNSTRKKKKKLNHGQN